MNKCAGPGNQTCKLPNSSRDTLPIGLTWKHWFFLELLPSNRNREVENHQHRGAGVMAEEIRYDCRSYDVVYFSNTNQTTVHDEGQKTLKDNERAFIFVLQQRLNIEISDLGRKRIVLSQLVYL